LVLANVIKVQPQEVQDFFVAAWKEILWCKKYDI
jgi:hypothetical protein